MGGPLDPVVLSLSSCWLTLLLLVRPRAMGWLQLGIATSAKVILDHLVLSQGRLWEVFAAHTTLDWR